MAVTVTVQLPDDPSIGGASAGFTRYIPLGGDGYTSPRTLVRCAVTADGDASGGRLTIDLRMDTAYIAVMSWVRVIQSQSTAVAFDMDLTPEAVGSFGLRTDNNVSGTAQRQMTWVPPPVILEMADGQVTPPRFTADIANVDTENLQMNAEIYLFNKRAREIGRAEDLLALIGRGGQSFYRSA